MGFRAPQSEAAMIESGAQIRAARALLGWSQTDLAKAASRHKNAVTYWESKSEITRRHRSGHLSGPRVIEEAFNERGIVFLPAPDLGVKHAHKPTASDLRSGQEAQFPNNTHARPRM
jgi:hypothetical protein